jgi:hypothetical protein
MKHKKNTRRRHKPRNKTRKTRNTHKKYKRCRTRRGGKTKEEVFAIVLSERLDAYEKSIPSEFGSYKTFLHFLSVYGEKNLQNVVCGDYSEEAIRLDATTQLANMKRILDGDSEPTPIIVKLKDLFLNRNFTQNWTDFVISLKKSVDARSSSDSDSIIKQRMTALKEDPLKPQPPLHKGLLSPPSHTIPAARPASAAAASIIPAIPAHVQQPGPPLPEGWSRYGPDHAPFYTNNLTEKGQNEFPTMPAALEQRLAQINNQDYNPPYLSPEDKRRAKEVGADLPEILIPPGTLEYKLANVLKD